MLSVSTSTDTTSISTPFPITPASSISNLVMTLNNTNPAATGVDYSTRFTATNSINGSPNFGPNGYVQITGAPGSAFGTNASDYTVTDGLRSLPPTSVQVDPVPPGDQLGLGDNVVDVYVPFNIPAGDKIQVDTSVINPTNPNAPRTASASTSSDAVTVPTTLGLQPTLNTTVGVTRTSGVVQVKSPGSKKFTVLTQGEIIPLGSTVNASAGTAQLKSALNAAGTSVTGDYFDGSFDVSQAAVAEPGHTTKVVVTRATLTGPNGQPLVCAAKAAKAARAARAGSSFKPGRQGRHKKPKPKPKRRKPKRKAEYSLWGQSAGNYSTVTSNVDATDIGTKWFTEETCAGTLIKVTQGEVLIDDLSQHRTFKLKAPGQFTAKP
jgi:hypothetical protein